MNLRILLSPTKNTNPLPVREKNETIPHFMKEAKAIIDDLKTKSLKELGQLMNVSDKIAQLNLDRFQNWKLSNGLEEEYHAIQMYAGEAFKAFDFPSLNTRYHEKMQESLYIISGLYGILKPFDLIHPYRLEMGLNYAPDSTSRNLYQFWNDRLTNYLDKNLQQDIILVNLASQEYSKVIDFNKLGRQVITPHFKDFKNGKYSTISMFSKNARGKMARFLIENDLKNIQDLKSYDWDGYTFSEKLSSDHGWVFVR